MTNKITGTSKRPIRLSKAIGSVSLSMLSFVVALLISSGSSAQNVEKAIPMGEWASFKTISYTEKPAVIHLRTGYENRVYFPEQVTLYAMNNNLVDDSVPATLPNCAIAIEANALRFSPLKRFGPQTVAVRGLESGFVYELLINSSPMGSRQPVELVR